MDRVNRVILQVLAEELELIGDERLELVTVTGVGTDRSLDRAKVWFSSLAAGEPQAVAKVLGEHRVRLQAAVARQVRLRRTPELVFVPDPAIAAGAIVEDILRGLQSEDPGTEDSEP